jgi:hypothetical protein
VLWGRRSLFLAAAHCRGGAADGGQGRRRQEIIGARPRVALAAQRPGWAGGKACRGHGHRWVGTACSGEARCDAGRSRVAHRRQGHRHRHARQRGGGAVQHLDSIDSGWWGVQGTGQKGSTGLLAAVGRGQGEGA